jgi:hypothetical protein
VDDILDMLSGIDKKNEIFTLWYEVTFLRIIISHLLDQSLYLQEVMTPEVIEECRKHAQKIVKERFPLQNIDFSLPKQPDKTTGESVQESPCCTHSDSSESQNVSPHP